MRSSKINRIFYLFYRFSLERQTWDQLLLHYQKEAEEIISRWDPWLEKSEAIIPSGGVWFELISVLLHKLSDEPFLIG